MSHPPEDPKPSRRTVVLAGLGAVAAGVLAACSRDGGSDSGSESQGTSGTTARSAGGTAATGESAATTLAPTPECANADHVTPAQTEGPYFKASSPARTDIRAGAGGTQLLLTGTVLTTSCQPVDRALVDFWQADGDGNYDNQGFGFRGHQFTDAQGRYRLETVVPGRYSGRTPHIHVKVQAPGGRVLTTQLYFPGEAGNASDGLFRSECLIDVKGRGGAGGGGQDGTFTFVLES